MSAEQSIIAELEAAMQSGSHDKRVNTLRRITDLFVADADRFDERELSVFDGVMEHLISASRAKRLPSSADGLDRSKMLRPGWWGAWRATRTSRSPNRC